MERNWEFWVGYYFISICFTSAVCIIFNTSIFSLFHVKMKLGCDFLYEIDPLAECHLEIISHAKLSEQAGHCQWAEVLSLLSWAFRPRSRKGLKLLLLSPLLDQVLKVPITFTPMLLPHCVTRIAALSSTCLSLVSSLPFLPSPFHVPV